MAKAITDLPADTNVVASDSMLITDMTNNVSKSVTVGTLFNSQTNVLGYSQITSSVVTRASSASSTGLSKTVNLVTGARYLKITAFFASVLPNGAASNGYVSIWDGAVGTGTILVETASGSGSNAPIPHTAMAVIPMPSGSTKTYNVGVRALGNSVDVIFSAATNNPAFLLVEIV